MFKWMKNSLVNFQTLPLTRSSSRMILQKLKGMHKVDHDEPEAETVRVMKKLKHVMANDEGTAVFETHLEDVKPDTPIK